MGIEQTQKYCQDCKQNVLAEKTKTNHILHLLLTIFTGGIWVIIWILATVASKVKAWKCSHCGRDV